MAGVGDLFKNFLNVVQTPQNAPLPALPNGTPNPGNLPPGASAAGNPTVPNATNQPAPKPGDSPQLSAGANANAAEGATPMDKFNDIWQTPENAVDPNTPITFTADPAKLLAASKNLDFKQFVLPEVMNRIAAGGEDAVKATMEAMNAVAQGTYAQSASATTKIVEKAVQETQKQFLKQIPTLVRNGSFKENLQQENPLFSHPAVSPVIESLSKQMAVKFPNASAQELTSMAKDYFQSLATGFKAPAVETPGNRNQPKEQDWGSYFDRV